ncbi:MAG: hypothetical protein RIT02_3500 [Planctomycetota bacterium]
MGVVLKVGTELVLVGSTWEGEAAAEPASLGGRGSCRAADVIGLCGCSPRREMIAAE